MMIHRLLSPRRRKLILGTVIGALATGFWGLSAESFIRAHLDDAGFRTPTRLYTRPIVLQAGTRMDRDALTRRLRRLGYRERRSGSVGSGEYHLSSWEWTIGRRPFRFANGVDTGGVATVTLDWGDRVSAVYDAAGHRMAYVILEPELLRTVGGSVHTDGVPVRLDEVPQPLIDAVLTIEDQRFFDHHGLDPRRIVGAALANVKARRITQGASTITQQLARTLWLSTDRTPIRKLREAALALGLEKRYSKRAILQAYLNQVYLGQNGAFEIRGVGRAAQYYFGKDVTQLSLAESALLAGIIRGPSLYAPFRNPKAAKARRGLVLELMHEHELISDAAYRAAKRAPLRLRTEPEPEPFGRYFAAQMIQQLETTYGRHTVNRGLTVFTTLDAELQRAAERAVGRGLAQLERSYPALRRKSSPLQAALVALDPWSGQVLAMVGGRDFGQSQFDRATMAHRQPGSAFKPVVALAALAPKQLTGSAEDDPPRFTLASRLEDRFLSVATPQGPWQPVDYDHQFRGSVTLREALEQSLNVPFARLGLAVGPDRVAAVGHALGIESRLAPVPSLALGASEVTLLDLTRAYGTLAAYGYRAPLTTTLAVVDREGTTLDRDRAEGTQVASQEAAYLVTSALEGAVERGTGRGLRRTGYDGPVAGKSGTTNDHRDAWFMAYTPSLAVGVWVGFDDGKSVGLPGARAALPIVAGFLNAIAPDDREFPVPSGVELVQVEPDCWGEREAFIRGTAPENRCFGDWRVDRLVSRGLDWLRERAEALGRRLGGGN